MLTHLMDYELISADGQEYHAKAYWLDSSCLPQAERLQEDIVATLPDKDLYYPLDRDELINVLGSGGRSIGVFAGERMIAFSALFFPKGEKCYLAAYSGIPPDEYERVAQLETFLVHPDFRRNELAEMITERLVSYLSRQKGRVYLMGTAAPGNIGSLRVFFALDLKIVALERLYNDSWRFVFFRRLDYGWRGDGEDRLVWLPAGDMDRQREILKNGMHGTDCRKNGEKMEIGYGAAAE